MSSPAQSGRHSQRLACLGSLVALIACGSEQRASAAADGGGHAALGAAGVSAGAGAKTNATTVAGKAGSPSPAGKPASPAAAGMRSAILDASVAQDDMDGGAAVGGSAGSLGTGSAGTSGAPAQTNNAGGLAGHGAPTATVSVTGQVIEAEPNGNFTPHAGSEVCVLDSAPPVCATSDASGKVALDVPANARTGLTLQQDGLFPMFTPLTTGTADIDLGSRAGWSNYGAAVIIAQETRTTSETMLGTKLDMTKGQADMIVYSLGGGTVTIEGSAAELKWFRNSAGQTTVTDGPAPPLSVLHGFTNIEPGMVTFRAERNGQPCRWDPMIWPGDQPGTVTVPIRAGWWTRLMEVQCD